MYEDYFTHATILFHICINVIILLHLVRAILFAIMGIFVHTCKHIIACNMDDNVCSNGDNSKYMHQGYCMDVWCIQLERRVFDALSYPTMEAFDELVLFFKNELVLLITSYLYRKMIVQLMNEWIWHCIHGDEGM